VESHFEPPFQVNLNLRSLHQTPTTTFSSTNDSFQGFRPLASHDRSGYSQVPSYFGANYSSRDIMSLITRHMYPLAPGIEQEGQAASLGFQQTLECSTYTTQDITSSNLRGCTLEAGTHFAIPRPAGHSTIRPSIRVPSRKLQTHTPHMVPTPIDPALPISHLDLSLTSTITTLVSSHNLAPSSL
jgi:hypothetical protein